VIPTESPESDITATSRIRTSGSFRLIHIDEYGVYQDPSHYFRLSQPHAQLRADFPGFVSAIGILEQLAHLARFREYILVMSEIVGLEKPTQ